MSAIVRLLGVQKAYGSVPAVREMTLAVEEGEFLTFLGPSGCGKTTTLRLISGFEQPDRGTIEIAGHDVTRIPPFRRSVNTVFQNYALFPHLSVFDNVAYGLVVKRRPRAEIARKVGEMLERIGLPEKAHSLPHELSGGQMQRVALARALVNEPSVLLLDEPLGALDAQLRRQMQIELKQMQRLLGMTFVYVTHDQEEAMVMSDRVVVMEGGLVQQVGDPGTIYARPANRFVAGFLGSANFIGATVAAVEDGAADLRLDGVQIRCAAAPGLAAGAPAALFVRPEHIAVCPATGSAAGAGTVPGMGTAEASNALTGRLVEVIHLGALRRLVMALGDTARVDVDLLSPAGGAPEPAPGSLWQLTIPRSAIAFPGASSGAGPA